MRLVPDTTVDIGDAYLTPFAVRVVRDTTDDGLPGPGEDVSLVIDVLNAGPVAITGASATLTAPPVDLTDDGVNNPVAMTVLRGEAAYGTIEGTLPTTDCSPPALHPASSLTEFKLRVPSHYPGDGAQRIVLTLTGTVNGSAFTQDVPLSIGVADRCDYNSGARDYDGLSGLLFPMARLVPAGDPAEFPDFAFLAGKSRLLRLRQFCGCVNLGGSDIDAPEIVGLSEAERGPIDISGMTLDEDTETSGRFFRWDDCLNQWYYNLRTTQLGKGVFTLKIRIAGRKDYVTGFELR
jgi:hypothetical protein